jgi:hypothetical protein
MRRAGGRKQTLEILRTEDLEQVEDRDDAVLIRNLKECRVGSAGAAQSILPLRREGCGCAHPAAKTIGMNED